MKKGDRMIVVDNGAIEPQQIPYVGTEVIVDDDNIVVPKCITYDGARWSFHCEKLRPAIKRGDKALFWDHIESKAEDLIFLSETPGSTEPFLAVMPGDEPEYFAFEDGAISLKFEVVSFQHCKPIEPEELTLQIKLASELLEHAKHIVDGGFIGSEWVATDTKDNRLLIQAIANAEQVK